MIEMEALGWIISIDPSAVLAPGMFLVLILALLSGFPVAFCLGGDGLSTAAKQLPTLHGALFRSFALKTSVIDVKLMMPNSPT